MSDAQLRLERVRRIVTEVHKHGDIFTSRELEWIVEDVQHLATCGGLSDLFVPVVVVLVEILIEHQLPAARSGGGPMQAIPPKITTFKIEDSDIAAVMEAYRAEHDG